MAKTNWQYNEVVTETDLNQLGQEINEKETIIGSQERAQQVEENAKAYVDGLVEGLETVVGSHKADTMPHRFANGGTTYRYGFSVESGGLMFNYEEVE